MVYVVNYNEAFLFLHTFLTTLTKLYNSKCSYKSKPSTTYFSRVAPAVAPTTIAGRPERIEKYALSSFIANTKEKI